MVHKCCVSNCKGNYDSSGEKAHMFKFPDEDGQCDLWLRPIHRYNFSPTGHTKIGSILSSLSIAGLLVFVVLLDAGISVGSAIHEENNNDSFSDDDYVDTQDQPKKLFELFQENIGYVKIALYVVLALALLMVVTSSMLIHGVRRDRRGLLLPFIIQEVVNIIILIALDVAVVVLFGAPEAIIAIVLCVAGGCFLQIYLLLVVISQYQALGLLRMHEEISMK